MNTLPGANRLSLGPPAMILIQAIGASDPRRGSGAVTPDLADVI